MMRRPATSAVSALSGFVAYGRQAMQHVSSPLPKIPYVGFSPVRLQTGLLLRPSRPGTPNHLYAAVACRRPRDPVLPLCVGNGPVSARLRSRGPWLASGLCCPAGSSRTMTSSEALVASRRLPSIAGYTAGLCPRASGQSFPDLLCVSFYPCHLPYPGGPEGGGVTVPSPSVLAFATFGQARHPHWPTQKLVHAWSSFRGCKVRFMLRPGQLLALHQQGLLLSSFHPMSHLNGTSSITTRANRQFPWPVFHRLDTQPYGLQPNTNFMPPRSHPSSSVV